MRASGKEERVFFYQGPARNIFETSILASMCSIMPLGINTSQAKCQSISQGRDIRRVSRFPGFNFVSVLCVVSMVSNMGPLRGLIGSL